MKIRKLLMTCFCLFLLMAFSINTFAQKRFTINVNKVSLDMFFQELRKKTGVEFVYSELQAKNLQPVTLTAKNESLENILKKLLSNSNYTYTLKNKAVLIVAKEGAKITEAQTTKGNQFLVNGLVVDTKGNPSARATVKVPGSVITTMTNLKGVFSIMVDEGEKQLQVSSVGLQTQLVNIVGKQSVKVIMKEGTNELDDVVVVAYGTTTKREQTGSISVVTAKEIADVPSATIAKLLQGRVAGMDVTNMSGSPGSGGTAIVIRGYNSLDVEQERRYSAPLWVIDGVPMNTFTSPITGTNLLSDLNPDMIESIQVLKDASSAAIYGSRAANGVILVTTKKGNKNQKAVFSLNASQTLSILPKLPTITIGAAERAHRIAAVRNTYGGYFDQETNTYKIPQSLKEMYEKGGSFDGFFERMPNSTKNGTAIYQDSLNSFYNNSTNFFPLFFETARVTNANFQTYGGSEKMSYGIGMGFYDEAGILKGTGYNRIDFNSSMQVKPVKNALVDARFNLSTGSRKRGTPSQGGLQSAPLIEIIPGDPLQLSSLYPGEDSPVWESIRAKLEGTQEVNRSLRLRASLRLSYNFLENFEFSTSGSLDYSLERRNFFTPSYLDGSNKGRNTSLGEQGINMMALNENLLSYKKNWGEHNLNALVGQSFQFDQNDYNGGYAMNTPSDMVWYASTLLPQYTKDIYGGDETIVPLQRYMSDMSQKTLLSWFGRVEYNYKKRYLLSVAFRKDGSSVFGVNNKWGTFPSVGAGYNFAEDLNWKPMNFGKFRFSWGRSGLQFYHPSLALGVLFPSLPFQGQSTLEPNWLEGLYNTALSWEETDQYDIGFDFDFFNSRLSVVTDYYLRYTDKLLDRVPLPRGYNTYLNQWRNAAAISNEGIEILIKYEILRKPDLFWKVTFNGARNWNRFAKSYGNYAEASYNIGNIGRIVGKPLNGIMVVQTNGLIQQQNEVPFYYNANGSGFYFGDPLNGYGPGDWKITDADGDGKVGSGDYVFAGSALPTFSGGVGSEFKYKNFDFNMLFSFQTGRHILNLLPGNSLLTGRDDRLVHPLLIDLNKVTIWEKSGDLTDFPQNKFEADGKSSFNLINNSYLQKVSWVKLKTLVLGYNWKSKWILKTGIQQARFFVSGENLFTLTNYKGIDPEVVDLATGIDNGRAYPLARKLTLGLTVKF